MPWPEKPQSWNVNTSSTAWENEPQETLAVDRDMRPVQVYWDGPNGQCRVNDINELPALLAKMIPGVYRLQVG